MLEQKPHYNPSSLCISVLVVVDDQRYMPEPTVSVKLFPNTYVAQGCWNGLI